jgi:transposase
MLAEMVDVVIGIDTHKHSHAAAVVAAGTGGVLAELTVAADPDGFEELVVLADGHDTRRVWAIEGSGSYGAALCRFLQDRGETVVEVDRPTRPVRRQGAKSDPIDAVLAAREVLSRKRLGEPRSSGDRQALQALLAARNSAVQCAGDTQRQLHALVLTVPDALRERLRGLSTHKLVTVASALRVQTSWDLETRTSADVLRALARRVRDLETEADTHHKAITAIVRAWHPELLDEMGVGPIVAATLLCAWSHPGRIHSEAAFAKLAGTSPVEASSGQIVRHRLNRWGDRQLNRALHVVAIHRMRHDPETKAYVAKGRSKGKTDREIRRCLKRYLARHFYRLLQASAISP